MCAIHRWTHDPVVMVITIRMEATDPPAGRVTVPGGSPVAFVGWLGLLRVLSELMASPND